MSAILSPQMRAVLASITHPHPDDEPFPPVRTIKALARRGLIRLVSAREEAADTSRGSLDIIMAALGTQRILATPAGHAALRAPPPPPAASPGNHEQEQ